MIHLTLIPYLAAAGELKTKPTQHSVKTLLEYGVQPDILVCRTEHKLSQEIRKKLALFCNVNINAVVESIDASTIYDVPLLMLKEQLDKTVLTKLKLSTKNEPNLENWKAFLGRLKNPTNEVNIALVGKYVELPDAYKSISEGFIHAGAANETKVKVKYFAAESMNDENVAEKLKNIDGVLVAPGFGERGLDGKLSTIKYVRENKIPFFGICLGMQLMTRSSEEGKMGGLGWIKADTKRFRLDSKYKVPHMGWNNVEVKSSTELTHSCDALQRYYFVHSYYFDCANKDNILAETKYGTNFASIVGKENIYGVQFHPEKSSSQGLNLLKEFIRV